MIVWDVLHADLSSFFSSLSAFSSPMREPAPAVGSVQMRQAVITEPHASAPPDICLDYAYVKCFLFFFSALLRIHTHCGSQETLPVMAILHFRSRSDINLDIMTKYLCWNILKTVYTEAMDDYGKILNSRFYITTSF